MTNTAAAFIAAEYFTRDGSPVPPTSTILTDEKGRPFIAIRSKCCRCGGTGVWKGHFEGVCFRCGGQGFAPSDCRDVKLYTVAENAKLDASLTKRQAAKAVKQAAERQSLEAAFDAAYPALLAAIPAEWLDGTSAFWSQFHGYTSTTLTPTAEGYGYENDSRPQAPDCIVILREIVQKGRRFGTLKSDKQLEFAQRLASEGQAKLDQLAAREAARAKAAASSQFVGEVGQKLADIAVTCQSVATFQRTSFDGRREETVNVCTFVDARGFVYVTKTPTFRAEKGQSGYLTGTVKAHTEYRGVKQTQLTRAKLVAW